MDTTDTRDTAKYAHIVGVFRDRAKAAQAIEALMQACMSDAALTVYDPQAAGGVDTPVEAGEVVTMEDPVDASGAATATRVATATTFPVHIQDEGGNQHHPR